MKIYVSEYIARSLNSSSHCRDTRAYGVNFTKARTRVRTTRVCLLFFK